MKGIIPSCTTSHPSLTRLEARIEQEVRARIWPSLLQLSVFKHCKHSWKHGCDCDYCTRKRHITRVLSVDAFYDGGDWSFERWSVFNSKRHWYRSELKQMRSEALASLL